MKNAIIQAVILIHLLFTNCIAHSDKPITDIIHNGRVTGDFKVQINALVIEYYGIKDALVATNGKTAQQKANDLLQVLSQLDKTEMTKEQKNMYTSLVGKIKSDTEHISETQDIAKQRAHFNDLSNNLFEVLKALGINESPVYQQYCPMKKAYWLSNNSAIRNPYYGNQMLTCGKVTETLK